jgi:hypothetical protein
VNGQDQDLAGLFPEKKLVPIVEEAVWVPRLVWTVIQRTKSFAPRGFDPAKINVLRKNFCINFGQDVPLEF